MSCKNLFKELRLDGGFRYYNVCINCIALYNQPGLIDASIASYIATVTSSIAACLYAFSVEPPREPPKILAIFIPSAVRGEISFTITAIILANTEQY